MTEDVEPIFRLRDPCEGAPLPPPGQENFLPGALFAASSATVVAFAVVRMLGPGVQFALPPLGAAVYLGFLSRAAFLARPRTGGERRFRRLMLVVQVQAILYAASTVYVATPMFQGDAPGPVARLVFGVSVLSAFTGLGASFLLQGVARRARPLAVAQFVGPFLMLFAAGGGLAVA